MTGGEIDANGVLVPTVIADAKPDMAVCIKEVFGPVVAIQTIDSVDEGLKLANDTAYGLQAAIFTQAISHRLRGGSHARLRWRPRQRGTDLASRPDAVWRDSRLGNTREGPAYSVHEMTETRLVIIDTAP